MTDILLISNSVPNINAVWKRFCYEKEYNANATLNVDSAMESLCSDDPPQLTVYYCGGNCSGFFPFYRTKRGNPKSAVCPLILLTDVEFQKALSEYVKLENTQVLSILINDNTLRDVIRSTVRNQTSRKTHPARS